MGESYSDDRTIMSWLCYLADYNDTGSKVLGKRLTGNRIDKADEVSVRE